MKDVQFRHKSSVGVCGGARCVWGGGGHNIKQMYLGKKNQIDILWSN